MHIYSLMHNTFFLELKKYFFVFIFSITGLFCGVFFCFYRVGDFGFFDGAINFKISFLTVGLSIFIPYFLFLICLYFSTYKLCLFLVFVESFFRGFSGSFFSYIYGSSAWLIRPLVMFSGNAVSVLFFWLLIRHLHCKQKSFLRDSILSASALFVVFFLNIFVVSPFCSSLLKYS